MKRKAFSSQKFVFKAGIKKVYITGNFWSMQESIRKIYDSRFWKIFALHKIRRVGYHEKFWSLRLRKFWVVLRISKISRKIFASHCQKTSYGRPLGKKYIASQNFPLIKGVITILARKFCHTSKKLRRGTLLSPIQNLGSLRKTFPAWEICGLFLLKGTY